FIHIAERSSLIIELDRWVLERCCERLAGWRDRDALSPIRLAVNISGRHLMEGDLVADVAAALERTGADPSMLEIELTETHLLGDLDLAVETLRALRDRGVRISIDDFGTGYSAMNHLRHLPIDSIKIDRSFIVAARVSDADAAVVDAVLAIGRSHGLEVVAEGIETAEDLEFVRGRGCDRGQGYYISYPLPIESAEALMFSTLAMQHA
ncbi:MAG: EAL domain-containing protein, partial [Rhodocyclaceae bacterium]|nr:EAL domain-containing protein [Rhodocyclaceae bacterium]